MVGVPSLGLFLVSLLTDPVVELGLGGDVRNWVSLFEVTLASVTAVEVLLESLPAVAQLGGWFQSVLGFWISLPLDDVLPSGGYPFDPFDFVDVVLFWLEMKGGLDGCGRVRRFQERYVEDRMYVCILGEFEAIVLWSTSFGNQKWSDFDLIQFFGHSSCFEVFGVEVHLIPLLKLRCRFSFALQLSCNAILGLCDSGA